MPSLHLDLHVLMDKLVVATHEVKKKNQSTGVVVHQDNGSFIKAMNRTFPSVICLHWWQKLKLRVMEFGCCQATDKVLFWKQTLRS